MTFLQGQARYKWIEEKYAKFRRRKRVANALFVLSFVLLTYWAFFGAPFLGVVGQPVGIAGNSGLLLLFLATFGFFANANSTETATKLLPPVEDRFLYHLAPALVSLQAYVTNWSKDDQKKCLKKLEKLSYVLSTWDTGNLRFVNDGVGVPVSDFKKNFRGRVIPAVRSGEKKLAILQIWLDSFRDILEKGSLGEDNLSDWNNYFVRSRDPEDPTSEPWFPYVEPSPTTWQKILSKKYHMSVIFLVSLATVATYLIAYDVVHTSSGEAFTGASTVFTGMIVLAVFLLDRQKRS